MAYIALSAFDSSDSKEYMYNESYGCNLEHFVLVKQKKKKKME